MSRGKKYQAIKQAAPTEKATLQDAVDFLKSHAAAAFDETIELHIRLGIDPSKSDQMVRGSATLPSGTPKKQRIAVFTADSAAAKEAKAAGAAIVGGQELIDQITDSGSLDVDITIASPDMMPKVAKIAKILGPKGLMPNPKTGTVTPNVAAAVTDLAGGKISFKMDQLGNIHQALAKLSWEEDAIITNIESLLEAVRAARPAGQKGEYIRSVTLATTMGPGISVDIR